MLRLGLFAEQTKINLEKTTVEKKLQLFREILKIQYNLLSAPKLDSLAEVKKKLYGVKIFI